MSKLIISDCHLDLKLNSGTTKETRSLLQLKRYSVVRAAIENHTGTVLDCGDILHSPSCSNLLGWSYLLEHLQEVDMAICGNHDRILAKGSMTTLGMLAAMRETVGFKTNLIIADYESPAITILGKWGLIPDIRTQEEFLELIDVAIGTPAIKYLVIHANWMLGEELCTPTTLNITKEVAERLAERFIRVFMGHNHSPGEYMGGVIVSVGTPYPCNIKEAKHDCRVINFNQTKNELTSIKTYDASMGYLELEQSMEMPVVAPTFVKLVGDWERGTLEKVVQRLFSLGSLVVNIGVNHHNDINSEINRTEEEIDSYNFLSSVEGKLSPAHNAILSELRRGH